MALLCSSHGGTILAVLPSNTQLCRRPTLRLKAAATSANLSLSIQKPIFTATQPRVNVCASVPAQFSRIPILSPPAESSSFLIGSTRTVTTIVTLAFALSRLCLNCIKKFSLSVLGNSFFSYANELLAIRALQSNLVHSAGPIFFASLKDFPRVFLNTPFTVVAAGLAKWLDIYYAVLLIRVLLSWFPNTPWDRQPLSAIRDLCDPYLSLFRNIIPPVFDTLDVSPLLAFAILGAITSILKSNKY